MNNPQTGVDLDDLGTLISAVPACDEKEIDAVRPVEELLGHEFKDRRLLVMALTHPSAIETARVSYERLEFLGDAVLGLVASQHLYQRFPDLDEGELTRIKSSVVSRTSLSKIGRKLDLARYLRLGKGMQGAVPRSVISNCVESLLGALYIDAGYDTARRFVLEHLADSMLKVESGRGSRNLKSQLQHLTQKLGLGTPAYRLITAAGPDHERIFEVCAAVGERNFQSARGSSKKLAEQRAARLALRQLETETDSDGSSGTRAAD